MMYVFIGEREESFLFRRVDFTIRGRILAGRSRASFKDIKGKQLWLSWKMFVFFAGGLCDGGLFGLYKWKFRGSIVEELGEDSA